MSSALMGVGNYGKVRKGRARVGVVVVDFTLFVGIVDESLPGGPPGKSDDRYDPGTPLPRAYVSTVRRFCTFNFFFARPRDDPVWRRRSSPAPPLFNDTECAPTQAYVFFNSADSASRAQAGIHGRMFAGKTLHVVYVTADYYTSIPN
jgi:hypothetical protein